MVVNVRSASGNFSKAKRGHDDKNNHDPFGDVSNNQRFDDENRNNQSFDEVEAVLQQVKLLRRELEVAAQKSAEKDRKVRTSERKKERKKNERRAELGSVRARLDSLLMN